MSTLKSSSACGRCLHRLGSIWIFPILFVSVLTFPSLSELARSETPGSDPQAVALAKAAREAMGRMQPEIAIKADAMVLVQGAMQKGSMQWLAQGPRAWRSELQLPDGKWSYGHWRGHEKFRNTKSNGAGVHERWAPSLGADFFPAANLLMRVDDTDVRIEWVRKEEFAGHLTDHIRLILGGAAADASSRYADREALIRTKKEDLYLDPVTHLVRGIRYCISAEGSAGRFYPEVEVRFDDYRVTAGTVVPFAIEKHLMGKLIAQFIITEIDFSRKLGPLDFDVAGDMKQ